MPGLYILKHLRVSTLSPMDDPGDPGGVEVCFGTA